MFSRLLQMVTPLKFPRPSICKDAFLQPLLACILGAAATVACAEDLPRPNSTIFYGGATSCRTEIGRRPSGIPSTYELYFREKTHATELAPDGGGKFVFGTINPVDAVNYAYMKADLKTREVLRELKASLQLWKQIENLPKPEFFWQGADPDWKLREKLWLFASIGDKGFGLSVEEIGSIKKLMRNYGYTLNESSYAEEMTARISRRYNLKAANLIELPHNMSFGAPTVYTLPHDFGWTLPQAYGHDIDLEGTYVCTRGKVPVLSEINLPNGPLTWRMRKKAPQLHNKLVAWHMRYPSVLPTCRDMGFGVAGSLAGRYAGKRLGGNDDWGNVGGHVGGMSTELAISAITTKGALGVRIASGLRSAGLWAAPINAATETIDAVGLLPQCVGGTGMFTPGWSDEIEFRQETMPTGSMGSYLSSSFSAFSKPLRSLWTIGEGTVETGCIWYSEWRRD